MSKIEERVVSMKLQNSQFLNAIKTTLGALASLKDKLDFKDSTKGFSDLDAAAQDVDLKPMGAGVDSIKAKFAALATVAITALANITNKVVDSALRIGKAFTVQPITEGFEEYELKLGSIQTIMNATGEPLDRVNSKLDDLNTYADKTIYSFSDMTNNIGKFTNAGIDLDTSVAAIQGISNAAALAGAGTNDASRAMFNLSQALSQGSVRLQDWMSIENANMATAGFREELIKSAVAAGTLEKAGKGVWKTMEGTEVTVENFRNTLADQWLTSDALIDTLGKYSDETTELGKKAFASAQDVKSATQLMDTLKEAVGSGWAQTFEIIVGDFNEAKELFTNVSDVLGGMIDAQADARNAFFNEWKDAGGRDAAIQIVANAFKALMSVIKPLKDAFAQIFPPMTGKQFASITKAIAEFMEKLTLSTEAASKLQRIFAGVFAVLDIGWQVIKMAVDVLGNLFGAATAGSTGIMELAASFGDFLVGVRDSIKSGDGLLKFFNRLSYYLVLVVTKVRQFVTALVDGIRGVSFDDADEGIKRISKRLSPLQKVAQVIGRAFRVLFSSLDEIWELARKVGSVLGAAFSKLGSVLMEAFNNLDYSLVLDTINTGLLAGLFLLIRNFFGDVTKEASEFGGLKGIVGTIKGAFGGLTETMETMQTALKSKALLNIAIAIGVLTASVIALSLIDSKALGKALAAMSAMFLQLGGMMAVFTAITGKGGFLKMPIVAAGLILLATAINILALAVRQLSGLSWTELAKGISSVAVLLGALALYTKFAETNKGALRSGAGLLLLAFAIKVLASAVGDFASYNWSELGKGMASIVALLAALAIFANVTGNAKRLVSMGASLILVGAAMKILASAVGDFASMSWVDLGKGMAAMAGALILIGTALTLMPASTLLSATALVVVAGALKVLASILEDMGGMSWMEIAKSLVVLAGSLAVIAGAMALMTGALPGAAALIIVAGALSVLAPVLLAFSQMTWGEIATGLAMLAGALAIIGVAGLVLTPVVPTLLLLGGAIALLGLGAMLAGAGVLAFSAGLAALAISGAAGAAALVAIIGTMLSILPMIVRAIGETLVQIANVIAVSAPAIVQAIVIVIAALLNGIIVLTPKIIQTFIVIMRGILGAINTLAPSVVATFMHLLNLLLAAAVAAIPRITRAGLDIIIGFLTAIRDKVPEIIPIAADIIVNFLDSIADALPRIIESGVNLIISFIEGCADAVRNNSDRMNQAGLDLASAVVQGMVSGISGGVGAIKDAAVGVAKSALDGALDFLGIRSPSRKFMEVGRYSSEGFAVGLSQYSGVVANEATNVGKDAIFAMKKSIRGISNVLDAEMDLQPKITPVLDLASVRKSSQELGSLIDTPKISMSDAYSRAQLAERTRVGNEIDRLDQTNRTVEKKEFQFVQHNTSPKALSAVEIYRQTKNLISAYKED